MKNVYVSLIFILVFCTTIYSQPIRLDFIVDCICSVDEASGSIHGHQIPAQMERHYWSGPHGFTSTAWELFGLADTGLYILTVHNTLGQQEVYSVQVTFCYELTMHITNASQGAYDGAIEVAANKPGDFICTWYRNEHGSTLMLPDTGMHLAGIAEGYYGLYLVEQKSGCHQSHHFIVENTEVVSAIKHTVPTVSWQLYPNPFAHELCVQFQTSHQEEQELVLRNAFGHICRQISLSSGEVIHLDVSELPVGVYSASLIRGSHILSTQLLVKQ